MLRVDYQIKCHMYYKMSTTKLPPIQFVILYVIVFANVICCKNI